LTTIDANGRLLLDTKVSHHEKLDIRDFPEGILFLKLFNPDSNGSWLMKILISRSR
jgi:hypothetical protein